jgi:hypothetical protein
MSTIRADDGVSNSSSDGAGVKTSSSSSSIGLTGGGALCSREVCCVLSDMLGAEAGGRALCCELVGCILFRVLGDEAIIDARSCMFMIRMRVGVVWEDIRVRQVIELSYNDHGLCAVRVNPQL